MGSSSNPCPRALPLLAPRSPPPARSAPHAANRAGSNTEPSLSTPCECAAHAPGWADWTVSSSRHSSTTARPRAPSAPPPPAAAVAAAFMALLWHMGGLGRARRASERGDSANTTSSLLPPRNRERGAAEEVRRGAAEEAPREASAHLPDEADTSSPSNPWSSGGRPCVAIPRRKQLPARRGRRGTLRSRRVVSAAIRRADVSR